MIAWVMFDRAKCPNCGTIAEEWLTRAKDPETGEESLRPVIPPPYEPDVHECLGCHDRARFEAGVFDDKGPPVGSSVVLRRSDPSEYPPERWTGPSVLDEEAT